MKCRFFTTVGRLYYGHRVEGSNQGPEKRKCQSAQERMEPLMKHNTNYAIDHVNTKIIVTKRFLKEAGMVGSAAYNQLLMMRHDMPEYEIVAKDTKKPVRVKPGANLTYKKMRAFIAELKGHDSDEMKEFEHIVELAKCQANPFAYTKTWFLKEYGNELGYGDGEDAANNVVELKKN